MAVRNYKMPDAEMFQASRTKRQHFINHKPVFVAFDPDFDGTFEADWLASIEASEGTETAEARDDLGQQETADVTDVMKLAFKKHIEMKYFINKAYGTKPSIMNSFGLDDYDKARSSQAKMAVYLTNLHSKSNSADYKPALLAANCTQVKIDEILTIKQQLSTEDTEQNSFNDNESVATKARIDQYNQTFGFWHSVNAASKVVFQDQPELLNLFLFPRNTEPVESFNVLGNVTVNGAPAQGVVVQIESLGLSTTTDNNGEYGFAGVGLGDYILKCTKTGLQVSTTPFTLGASPVAVVNVVMVPV